MAGRQARLIAAVALLARLGIAGVDAEVDVPAIHVVGHPLTARVELVAGAQGDRLPTWMLTTAAFAVDGKPLGERGSGEIRLAPRQKIRMEIDLGPALDDLKPKSGSFQVAYGSEKAAKVAARTPAKKGADYMAMSAEDLANHEVLLLTNQGPIVLALWPDVAPNHVRNFLDLTASGFYDGTQFHRVSPAFMVQGGCPNTRNGDPSTWGQGSGKRQVKLESSRKTHARGVLSMARGPSPDSASCQFFVVTAPSPSLDGQYSAFGELVDGFTALDAIARAPGVRNEHDGTVRPTSPQKIESALVLVKNAK